MEETMVHNKIRKKEKRLTLMVFWTMVLFATIVILSFLQVYRKTIDETLYNERLSQMREITNQVFSGLEDVVKGEWLTVETQTRMLHRQSPKTVDSFIDGMKDQAEISSFDMIQASLIAVDDNGWYYLESGRQGLLLEREYLNQNRDRLSFVSNAMTGEVTRMVFLQKLENPIVLQDGEDIITLTYYGIAQNMEQLNPYFKCNAYGGANSVYVIDDDGLKLFNSSEDDLLKGYNVYSALNKMEYLHDTSFEDTREKFRQNNVAYSNAKINGTEVYYALYKMENSAWSLLFLVPSSYVATSTVQLVNDTVKIVVSFTFILLVFCTVIIVWLTNRQKQMAVLVEKENNERLEALNEQLVSANKAKSEFLANMSHDIRTPMNAIVGIVNLLNHESNLTEKEHTYLKKIQMSSKHLLGLINDVLDMSKIESKEVNLNTEPICLAEQVGQVENIIRPQANEKGHEFNIRVHEVHHEYLIGDSVRLRQIFINLLSNAVKYTQDGGKISLDLEELPCDVKEHATIRITVTDNGYGMSKQFASHIFEPFKRAENSVTNKVQGTGLGMAITKSIVEMMNGTITVQSEEGKGSCFEVTLTMAINHEARRDVNVENVLLVSDDEEICRNISASIKEASASLMTVETPEQALEQLQQQNIDTILLAGYLNNKDLSGIVSKLRNAKEDVMIFCCDYAQIENVQDILKSSDVNGLIARPFFLSNLIQAVDDVQNHQSVSTEVKSALYGMRFLCAEDNVLNAEILQAILEVEGAACKIYPNGKELVDAFKTVKKGDYDAILMDVQMPEMNGLEATRAIRSGKNPLGKEIQIIAMTANAFSEDVKACLDAGMNAHISKPLDIKVLEQRLRELGNEHMFSGGGDIKRYRNNRLNVFFNSTWQELILRP